MHYSPSGCSVHGILQARILECVAMPSLEEIFPTQRSNPGVLHCRWILYSLSHQGSPLETREGTPDLEALTWLAAPCTRLCPPVASAHTAPQGTAGPCKSHRSPSPLEEVCSGSHDQMCSTQFSFLVKGSLMVPWLPSSEIKALCKLSH